METENIPGLFQYKFPIPTETEWSAFVERYQEQMLHRTTLGMRKKLSLGETFAPSDRQNEILALRKKEIARAPDLLWELAFTDITLEAFLQKHAPAEAEKYKVELVQYETNLAKYEVNLATYKAGYERYKATLEKQETDPASYEAKLVEYETNKSPYKNEPLKPEPGPEIQTILYLMDDIGQYSSMESEESGSRRRLNNTIIERLTHKWIIHESAHHLYPPLRKKKLPNDATELEIKEEKERIKENTTQWRQFAMRPEGELMIKTLWGLHNSPTDGYLTKATRKALERGIVVSAKELKGNAPRYFIDAMRTYNLSFNASLTTHYIRHLIHRPANDIDEELYGTRIDTNSKKLHFIKGMEHLHAPISDDPDADDIMSTVTNKKSPVPANEASKREMQIMFGEVLKQIPPRYARVLELRFGFNGERPRTLEGAGRRMTNAITGETGVTKERIRQLEAKAFEAFKKQYEVMFGKELEFSYPEGDLPDNIEERTPKTVRQRQTESDQQFPSHHPIQRNPTSTKTPSVTHRDYIFDERVRRDLSLPPLAGALLGSQEVAQNKEAVNIEFLEEKEETTNNNHASNYFCKTPVRVFPHTGMPLSTYKERMLGGQLKGYLLRFEPKYLGNSQEGSESINYFEATFNLGNAMVRNGLLRLIRESAMAKPGIVGAEPLPPNLFPELAIALESIALDKPQDQLIGLSSESDHKDTDADLIHIKKRQNNSHVTLQISAKQFYVWLAACGCDKKSLEGLVRINAGKSLSTVDSTAAEDTFRKVLPSPSFTHLLKPEGSLVRYNGDHPPLPVTDH